MVKSFVFTAGTDFMAATPDRHGDRLKSIDPLKRHAHDPSNKGYPNLMTAAARGG